MQHTQQCSRQSFNVIDGDVFLRRQIFEDHRQYPKKQQNISTAFSEISLEDASGENEPQNQSPSTNQENNVQDLPDDESPPEANRIQTEQAQNSETSKSIDNSSFNLQNIDSEIKAERNDSKNVPKGMIKAFAHWVLSKDPQNMKILQRFFFFQRISLSEYQQFALKIRRSPKISIGEIREMLLDGDLAEVSRKLTSYFMRRKFLNHIFNSKMQKCNIHLKYIHRWKQIFKNPQQFQSLK